MVPTTATTSGGQTLFVPSQTSSTSQSPSAPPILGLHIVPAGFFASVGQVPWTPSHRSTSSHASTASRHGSRFGRTTSGGQRILVPVHTSSTSQSPMEGRQTVVLLPGGCVHAAEVPL